MNETVRINGKSYEVEYDLVPNPVEFCMDVEITGGLPDGITDEEREEVRLEINGRLWEREQEWLAA